MPFVPGSGAPDGEARAMPHGDILLAGDAFAIPGGGANLPGIFGNIPIAAYRSLSVVIHNHGASDMDTTVTWDWNNATVHLRPTETQRVLAGQTKRMLFRNQGDLLISIRLAPTGAGGNVDYYVAGSNHDPLPQANSDWIYLSGKNSGITLAAGILTRLEMDNGFWTTDPTLWGFVLGPGGAANTVNLLQPGLYIVTATMAFGAVAGAYVKQLGSYVVVNVPSNYGNVNPLFANAAFDQGSVAADTTYAATTQCPVNSGGGYAFAEGYQASAGAVAVTGCGLLIQRAPAVT